MKESQTSTVLEASNLRPKAHLRSVSSAQGVRNDKSPCTQTVLKMSSQDFEALIPAPDIGFWQDLWPA